MSRPSSHSATPTTVDLLGEWGGVTNAVAQPVGDGCVRCVICEAHFADAAQWKTHLDTDTHVNACRRHHMDRFGLKRTPQISPSGTPYAGPIMPQMSLADVGDDAPPTPRHHQTVQAMISTFVGRNETSADDHSGDGDVPFSRTVRLALRDSSREQLEDLVVHLANRMVTLMQQQQHRLASSTIIPSDPLTSGTPSPPPPPIRRPTRLDAFALEAMTAPPSCEMRGMPPPASIETLIAAEPDGIDLLSSLTIPVQDGVGAAPPDPQPEVVMRPPVPAELVSRQASAAQMLSFRASLSANAASVNRDGARGGGDGSSEDELNDAHSPHRNDFSMSNSAAFDDDGVFPTLNDYVLLENIGAGATGEVLKASKDNKLYAIKKIARSKVREAPGVASGADARAATIAEVHALSKLHHRHIVRVIECIDDPKDKEIFLVMELVAGGAVTKVDQARGTCGKLPPASLRTLCTQMAMALNHIHGHDMCHGDVKPDNILVGEGAKKTSPGVRSPGVSPAASPRHSRTSTPFRRPESSLFSPTVSPRHRAQFDGPMYLLADFGVASAVLPASPPQATVARVAPSSVVMPPSAHRHPGSNANSARGIQALPSLLVPLGEVSARSPAATQPPGPVDSAMGSSLVRRYPQQHPASSLNSNSASLGSIRLPLSLNRVRNASVSADGSFANQGTRANAHSQSQHLTPLLDQLSISKKEGDPVSDGEDDADADARRAAAFAKRHGRDTVTGGTLCFDAPELFDGEPRTRASDMYALGATLYALLVGRVPFFADSWGELKRLVQTADVVFPDDIARECIDDPVLQLLCDAIENLMQKDPAARMSSRALFSHIRERSSSDPQDGPSMGTFTSSNSFIEPPTAPRPFVLLDDPSPPASSAAPAPLATRGTIARSSLPDRVRRYVSNATPSTIKAMRRVRCAMNISRGGGTGTRLDDNDLDDNPFNDFGFTP